VRSVASCSHLVAFFYSPIFLRGNYISMYLLYLDESGDPNGWNIQNNFVLGGVAVHEGQIYGLSRQLDNIQSSFFPGISFPIVFHATDIAVGKDRFRSLSKGERDKLLDAIYQIIAGAWFPNLIAFATDIDISCARSADQVIHDAFQDVCVRFNTFLMRQYKHRHPDKGLLLIDRAHQEGYRQLIADFRRSGTQFGYVGNIVDIPYFASRHDTRMLQLADFCAHAVFRRYEKKDTKYFDEILPRFDRRSKRLPPDGLKHITRNACSCEARH
jgi:hypothetical protein